MKQEFVCEISQDAKFEDIEHILGDIVLPKLLSAQGKLVLHGGLVRAATGLGIAVIAPSGFGKSTLCTSFLADGHSLLSDDSVLVDRDTTQVTAEGLCGKPRLFPDSAEHLFPQCSSSEPVVSYTDKRRIRLDDLPDGRVSLAAIFVLAPREDATEMVDINRLSQAPACMAMVANSFALDPSDPIQSRQRFTRAAEVARRVPVFELSYLREYDRLPEVRGAMLRALDAI